MGSTPSRFHRMGRTQNPSKHGRASSPDALNSPTRCTRSLSICDIDSLVIIVTYARTWGHSFLHLISLRVSILGSQRTARASLVQPHPLNLTLESVRLFYRCITLPEVLHLIRSFPLDDLQLCSLAAERNIKGWNTPTSPKLTRTFGLVGKVSSIGRGLLDLPGILHFANIKVWCPNYDAESVKGLVSKFSGTLESLPAH